MGEIQDSPRRAELEAPKLRNASGVSITDQDGDSSPAASDSAPPAKTGTPSPRNGSNGSGVKAHQVDSANVGGEFSMADRSVEAKASNGFRHLTLPMREGSRLVFQTDPHGLAAEQYRSLRRVLSEEFHTGGVLLISSPAMGDGKTLTSVNLCTCLAETGHPTLLVEMDIRRPTIHKVLNQRIEPPGVEDALAGVVEPAHAVHAIKDLNFYAAMVAKIPQNPSQLVSGPGVKNFLTWARTNFLWIVLDAPPVLPAADVPELLPLADAGILVIRAQSTPRELAKRAIEMLGKRLRGVIFNEITVNSTPYYGYLSDYYTPASDGKSLGLTVGNRSKE
jgi:capsular exopolysaccharide synthesis family protein